MQPNARVCTALYCVLFGCFDDDPAQVVQDPPPVQPPVDAMLQPYGATCTTSADCASGVCFGNTNSRTCTRYCSIAVPNDCKDVDAFCAALESGEHICYGKIDTGPDLDDANLLVGDTVTRPLTPLDDADLFLVTLNELGTITFTATPQQATIDLQLEAYGMSTAPLGIINNGGPGAAEAAVLENQAVTDRLYIAIRNVGTSTGSYTFVVSH